MCSFEADDAWCCNRSRPISSWCASVLMARAHQIAMTLRHEPLVFRHALLLTAGAHNSGTQQVLAHAKCALAHEDRLANVRPCDALMHMSSMLAQQRRLQ
jgi:hypothetical protein